MSNNRFCIQVNVDILFPLGPLLTNIFLSHLKENWFNECPIAFKPTFYSRYVDDIFVLFESPLSAHSLRDYVSSKHQNVSVEQELGSFSFSYFKICQKKVNYIRVPRKSKFSGLLTNYGSFIPMY